MIRILTALILLLLGAPAAHAQTPQQNADTLLAADRAFAAAAVHAATPADAVAAMFDADVVLPGGPTLTVGRDAVLAQLRAAPAWQSGAVSWRPVRAGISADGTQGFTYGFLTVTAGDPVRRERKYLAYWVRRPEGWRVAAWKQVPRPAGEVSAAMQDPSLPATTAPPPSDPAVAARHGASLAAAEQAFSDRAQHVGLGAAFREFGRVDAMNMGGGADFTIGAEAISRDVGNGEAVSPLHWSATRTLAASSGDLGVSMGVIHRNQASTDGRPDSFSFFTVWRRDTPDSPWRYIAE